MDQDIQAIIKLWRFRKNWIKAETKLILQGKALCRAWTSGDKEKANNLFKKAQKGEIEDIDLEMALLPFFASMAEFSKMRAAQEKNLKRMARKLPIWPWVKEIKGFAEIGLVSVIGEAGDLSNYPDVSKLWKRMGLAVMDGVRQGGLSKNAKAEEWIAHGYDKQRRSTVFANIGDPLIKGNKDGYYRKVYLDRKAYELARNPEMIPMHAHRRAQRYMEKRLLKHLWQTWRKANADLRETGQGHAANNATGIVPVSVIKDAAL